MEVLHTAAVGFQAGYPGYFHDLVTVGPIGIDMTPVSTVLHKCGKDPDMGAADTVIVQAASQEN
ncbi:hypothetical protein KJK34_03595 [Flavobacterium sp. D11R37]|uniref:hypothetical protein n=1 Tax=Flavobacterium coralii TaxID=2838017 RepID=UPI001CA74117|nr:hypothetical protein [Flavobacterium coralii]MBY8961829.1 hypothetical protein [Flavobacterium coralii]